MKYFKDHEFDCKCGCGKGIKEMDPRLLKVLDEAREHMNLPIRINSAVRCKNHNTNVGGSSRSEHVPENTHSRLTTGVDIHVPDSNFMYRLVSYFLSRGIPRIGWNQKLMFIHVGISENHPQDVFFKY